METIVALALVLGGVVIGGTLATVIICAVVISGVSERGN